MSVDRDSGQRRPLHVLREYTLLADGERGAVLGPRGEISWMCVPHWHSGSVFGELIGARGVYALTPTGRFVWGGYYEADTLIWRSRWITELGIVECREALAFPGNLHHAVLLRRVEPLDCDADLTVHLEPAAEYGNRLLRDACCSDGVWTAAIGGLHLRWAGAPEARLVDDYWTGRLRVPAGGHHDLVLEIGDGPLVDPLPRPEQLWDATAAAWEREVPRLDGSLAPGDARHSYAVLRGLTGGRGGMVAAATTSLPERAETGRSYDYRYVWIRDQSFAGQAVAADGPHPVLDHATRFVTARLLEHGPDLAPAYTTMGEPVPDERNLRVPGYPGGSDVIGNHVHSQFQLDAFGETLLLLTEAGRCDRLDADGIRAAGLAAQAIADRWREPDAGIWELEPRLWTHSRLIAVAGLRAVASLDSCPWPAEDCNRLADRILTDTDAHAVTPAGHWQRAPDDPRNDGALLLPGLRGAVPAGDARTVATLRDYLAELTDSGYAYRFRVDDEPLGRSEGAFLLCGFLTALALHQQGEVTEAARWFERTRAASGPPQLFSEEYDVTEFQLRGNLPQAFVHAYMIEASLRLAQAPATDQE